jgi:hypothetical protein
MALALTAIAILALPGGALAKPGFRRVAASTGFDFTLNGSAGYKITVVGLGRELSIQATKAVGRRADATVDYRDHGRPAISGSWVDVRLPGVASFNAHFIARGGTEKKSDKGGCTGARTVEKGYFVGSLVFHGERGFTKADARRVPGTVTRTPTQLCPRPTSFAEVPRPAGEEASEAEPEERTIELIAGERRRGLTLIGQRVETIADEPSFSQPILIVALSHRSRNLDTTHIVVDFEAPAASFSVSAPGISPPEATLTPPSPFSGSATFGLTSPKRASWSGDLAVELPGLGTVRLTGPKFYSGLCEGETCTKTLPKWYLRGNPYTTSVSLIR